MAAARGRAIDVLALDACLMQMVEIPLGLYSSVQYFVASQMTIRGDPAKDPERHRVHVAALDRADQGLGRTGFRRQSGLAPTATPSHKAKRVPDPDVLHPASISAGTYLPIISPRNRSQNRSQPRPQVGSQSVPRLMFGH